MSVCFPSISVRVRKACFLICLTDGKIVSYKQHNCLELGHRYRFPQNQKLFRDLGIQKDSFLMWAAGMPKKQPRATKAKKKASP